LNRQLRCIEHPEIRFTVELAESFAQRLIGLLTNRTAPAPGRGLLICPGGSVHSFGMREAIDVLHLTEHWQVIDHRTLCPWQIHIAPQATRLTLEIACGQTPHSLIGCYFMEEESCQNDTQPS